MEERFADGLRFLALVVTTFLALELLLLPLRGGITGAFAAFFYSFLPRSFNFVWECTGADEVLLLISVVLWSAGSRREKFLGAVFGAAIISLYNALRVAVLAYYPNEFLHDLLFRVGGFLVVVGAYWLYIMIINKRNN